MAGVAPGHERESHCADFLLAAKYLSPDKQKEVEALIRDLELEFWGAVKIETKEDGEPP